MLVNNLTLTVKQSNELATLENPSEPKDVLLKKKGHHLLMLALPTFTAGQTSHQYPAISPKAIKTWKSRVPT